MIYPLTPFAQRVHEVFAANPETFRVGHVEIENESISGRTVLIRGKECISFSSASYLGLEQDLRLKAGAIDAINRYGTQFSSSRSYLGLPQYSALESKFEQITGRPAVLAPTTTLSHLAFFPLYIHQADLVVMDMLAHASLHAMINLVKASGTEVTRVLHNDMLALEQKIKTAQADNRRVWYVADGIYSMYGDTVPVKPLLHLLNTYPNLYAYIDDAHGMGWCGAHGRGFALEHFGNHERIVVALSLAKAFGTGGGVLSVPFREMKQCIKESGGSLVFSGPLQPGQLGAGLASADILLSDELNEKQAKLRLLIETFIRTAQKYNLPLASNAATPVFFVEIGPQNIAFKLTEMLIEAGFYVNTGVFPAVALNKTGLRISLHNHLHVQDIEHLLRMLAELMPIAYAHYNTDFASVRKKYYNDATEQAK